MGRGKRLASAIAAAIKGIAAAVAGAPGGGAVRGGSCIRINEATHP